MTPPPNPSFCMPATVALIASVGIAFPTRVRFATTSAYRGSLTNSPSLRHTPPKPRFDPLSASSATFNVKGSAKLEISNLSNSSSCSLLAPRRIDSAFTVGRDRFTLFIFAY